MAEEKKKITSMGHAYETVRKLGDGYTGTVYLVKESGKGEPFALKFLNPEAFKEGQLEAFKREFSLLSDLHHPHLCKVYDFGYSESDERYFFTSELIQGTELYAYTDKLSLEEIEEIFVQIADGLGYIHAAGLIHFDIKGANILITLAKNRPISKIVDFGLAAPSIDIPENIVGTVRYISPEMITKDQAIDYRADLYSLGIVLYRMLAKRYPDQGNTMEDVLSWHTKHTSIDREGLVKMGVPDYLIEAIQKLTSPIPTGRFSSTSVLIKFIELHSGRSYKKTQRELLTTLTEEGPLVARDPLMQKVKAAIHHLSRSEEIEDANPTLILSGPPGIGKTRALKETKYISQLSDLNTIIINGADEGRDMDRLKKALKAPDGSGDMDIVAASAKLAPLCLMVDDMDLCNQQIRDVFTGFANYLYSSKFMGSPLPVYLILTMTTGGPQDTLPVPIHLGVDEEALLPLNEEDITAYIRQFLGESNPPVSQVKDIFSFSGGVPELVRTAIASLESSTARLTRDANKIFTDRMSCLTPTAKELLGIFAISEKPFRQEELISLTGSIVETGLNELSRTGLIKYDRMDDTYRMATGAIISAAKDSFTKEEIIKVSENLLKYTKENNPDDIDSLVKYASLCAGDEELCNYLVQGAERKDTKGEVDLAQGYYQKAIAKMAEQDTRYPEIHRKLARFAILTGKLTDASGYIDTASRLTTLTPDDLVTLSWVDRLQHRPKDALGHIQAALDLPDVQKDRIRYIKLLNEQAQCYIQMGQYKKSEEIFSDTEKKAQKLSEDERKKIANNNLGLALAKDGRLDDAISFYKKKFELFSGEKRLAASILSQLGYVYQNANMIDQACDSYKRSLDLSFEIGDTHNTIAILGNIINLCQSKALFTDALKYAQESTRLASKAASEKDLGSNFLTIGALYINLGVEDVAKKYLTESVSIFQKLGDKLMEAWAQLSFAYLYRNIGRHKEALAYFSNLTSQAEKLECKELAEWGCFGAAETCIDISEFGKAEEYLGKIETRWPGLPAAHENDVKFEFVRCKLAVYREQKSGGKIIEHLKELGEFTVTQGLRELASEIYHTLGRAYEKIGDDRTASEYIGRAKDIIDDIAGSLSEEYRDSYLKQHFRKAVSEESIKLKKSLIEIGLVKKRPEQHKEAEGTPPEAPAAKPPEGAAVGRTTAIDFTPAEAAPQTEPAEPSAPRPASKAPAPQKEVAAKTMGISGELLAKSIDIEIVGQSETILKIKDVISHVKDSHTTVIIYGEPGTGKELVAKNIHGTGSYRNTPWKMIDFSDLPEEFAMGEIFGLEKEALFEAAENGIVFLKHIEEMPQNIQKELLKTIKSRSFARLRDRQELPFKCRLISSSNLDCSDLLKKKKFNKELLGLLSGVPIKITPLRMRPEDIPLLIHHFLEFISAENNTGEKYTIDPHAIGAIVAHKWPGNVRELDQTLRGACATAEAGKITLEQVEVYFRKES